MVRSVFRVLLAVGLGLGVAAPAAADAPPDPWPGDCIQGCYFPVHVSDGTLADGQLTLTLTLRCVAYEQQDTWWFTPADVSDGPDMFATVTQNGGTPWDGPTANQVGCPDGLPHSFTRTTAAPGLVPGPADVFVQVEWCPNLNAAACPVERVSQRIQLVVAPSPTGVQVNVPDPASVGAVGLPAVGAQHVVVHRHVVHRHRLWATLRRWSWHH